MPDGTIMLLPEEKLYMFCGGIDTTASIANYFTMA